MLYSHRDAQTLENKKRTAERKCRIVWAAAKIQEVDDVIQDHQETLDYVRFSHNLDKELDPTKPTLWEEYLRSGDTFFSDILKMLLINNHRARKCFSTLSVLTK